VRYCWRRDYRKKNNKKRMQKRKEEQDKKWLGVRPTVTDPDSRQEDRIVVIVVAINSLFLVSSSSMISLNECLRDVHSSFV